MVHRISDYRLTWLAVGLVGGLCIAWFWPHEPARAAATDRSSKFALATVPVTLSIGAAGINTPETEAIFVLDFLTGRLTGGVVNPKPPRYGFSHRYVRNVHPGFGVNPNIEPNYAIVGGRMALTGPGQMASGVIYVAELSSGRVLAFGIPYAEGRPGDAQLMPLGNFAFRQDAAAGGN